MDCEEARRLLDASLDGELDLLKTLEIEAHIQECPACLREQARGKALRSAFRTAAPSLYYHAPERLTRRILRSAPREGTVVAFVPRRNWFTSAIAAAAILGIAALILPGSLRRGAEGAAQDRLVAEVVAGHTRSLMASHLTDVASSDHHTVKPWFSGKLDFSPPVVDLAGEGFPLIGGRLDELDERPVAALVYRHGKHLINLFLWPSEPGETERKSIEETTRRGYHVLHWSQSDLTYYVVSDMNEEELGNFAHLLQKN